MKDRVSTYPGRVKLVPVPGQTNTYDLERADEPLDEGTPLNKANLLSDETANIVWNGLPPAEPNVSGALVQVNENIALGTPKRVLLAEAVIPSFTDISNTVLLVTAGEIAGMYANIVIEVEFIGRMGRTFDDPRIYIDSDFYYMPRWDGITSDESNYIYLTPGVFANSDNENYAGCYALNYGGSSSAPVKRVSSFVVRRDKIIIPNDISVYIDVGSSYSGMSQANIRLYAQEVVYG